jgi:hypothetical protein
MPATLIHHEADILERAIDASGGGWSSEIARGFLSIKLSPADVVRMNELAEKSRGGALDADEVLEIESYRYAARLLEILKLRARGVLKQTDAAKPPSV